MYIYICTFVGHSSELVGKPDVLISQEETLFPLD